VRGEKLGNGMLGAEAEFPDHLFSPHYSRLVVSGSVDAILDTLATPMPLSWSLRVAGGPHFLCWEWSGGRRTS
jgi:hypothetical protein